MEINKEQQRIRVNIIKIRMAVQDSIDEICKDKDYKITYAEINAALSETIRNNNEYELKELWKDSKTD